MNLMKPQAVDIMLEQSCVPSVAQDDLDDIADSLSRHNNIFILLVLLLRRR